MKTVIFFFSVLIFIFICYLIYLFIQHKRKKLYKVGQYEYLTKKYKIDFIKLGHWKTIFIIAFCNSLIIANAVVVINYFYIKPVWAILISFFVLFISIYVVYGITGKILAQKK